jgi:hypothetical protein
MLSALQFIFFLSLNFSYLNAHSGENHENSKPAIDKVERDEDGFEIVSAAPSKKILDQINELYKRNVKKIFSNKCLSCHGVNNSPPWYYHIPGAKQLMDSDMTEAKKHMDMTFDFPFKGHGSPIDDLNSLQKTVREGSMPPLKYRFMHWDSELTAKDIKDINNWINKSKLILKE